MRHRDLLVQGSDRTGGETGREGIPCTIRRRYSVSPERGGLGSVLEVEPRTMRTAKTPLFSKKKRRLGIGERSRDSERFRGKRWNRGSESVARGRSSGQRSVSRRVILSITFRKIPDPRRDVEPLVCEQSVPKTRRIGIATTRRGLGSSEESEADR